MYGKLFILNIIALLLAVSVVDCRPNQNNDYSVRIIGIADLDSDSFQDTVLAYKYSNNVILPKYILWGQDSSGIIHRTEIIYPSSKVTSSYCLMAAVNKDTTPDLFLSMVTVSGPDSIKVSNTYIIYGNSSLKKNERICLEEIKGFQRKPFMAHCLQKSKSLSDYGYDKFNDKVITLIHRTDTDTLEEEQKKSVEMPSSNQLSVKIYPNPVSEILTLSFVKCKGCDIQLYISNLNGQNIITKSLRCSEDNIDEQIDISALPVGVYQLLLRNSDKFEHYSFVVMH